MPFKAIGASLILTLCALGSEYAQAVPTAACKALAKQFADKTDLLDLSDLAKLRTCVSEELNAQMATRRPPPPAPPPPPPPPVPPSK